MRRSGTRIVLGILIISLLLRWILILRGGQYYIADETRYEVSRDAARFLAQSQWGDALRQFTISPEHLAFKVVGIIPALLEHVAGPSLVLPAIFFSLFSVLNLYLIFLLSGHSQTISTKSRYALFLAASCLSLLYYSRHLFPYDMAMSFGLLAYYASQRQTQDFRISLICGGLSFLCFITYNGYWPLAGFAMLVNIFTEERKLAGIWKRILWTTVGFVAPLLILITVMLGSGTNMISAYRLFATSITQGAFQEGWRLPLEYLWHTEHFVILILGSLSVYAIMDTLKTRQKQASIWIGGIVFIYLCLVIPSVFLHTFVVYGRLARQLLPFLILLSAHGLALLEEHKIIPTPAIAAILTVIVIQAVWNFGLSYRLHYPRQFSEEVQAQFPGFEFSSKRLAYGAPAVCQNHGYVIENAKYFLAAPETAQTVRGEILRDVSHPVNFLPYQYEGYTPEQRRNFRERQLRMRFYEAAPELDLELKNCAVRGDEK